MGTMILHTCPVCGRAHPVQQIRAELAYGRQLTCSPDCESERRKRMRHRPFCPLVANRCEPWAIEGQMPEGAPRQRAIDLRSPARLSSASRTSTAFDPLR
jgi:hypothetical protein